MLRRLTIRDFVIVDHLELEFAAGFGALTGETGAGKSILLDALGLLLGGRGEAGMVRSGREKADLSAEFELREAGASAGMVRDWLLRQEIPDEDDALLLRRVVDASGRSRAWINGLPVSLTQLRELSEWLADIHGQHAHHALLKSDAQRELLDLHAGLGELAAGVAQAWRVWSERARLLEQADEDRAGIERERELLAWQVEELERIDLAPGAWEEINVEHARLAHAANLIEGAEAALSELGDGELAISSRLESLSGRFADLAGYDSELAAVQELLQGAAIQAEEALHQLRRYRDRVELDPARLNELELRIGAINDCARKYRVTPEALAELLEDSRSRLQGLEARANPEALLREERAAREQFEQLAGELSRRRAPAAQELGAAVSAAMQELAMAGGVFEVGLLALEGGSAGGLESVEFLVSANPGQPPRPLAKVASGGELSRIGLAIQVITSRNAATPTLIFDEVDVGIGGRVAEIVGRHLRQLGSERQVLCVTHLPQVAAQADWQWNIRKETRDGQTLSCVEVLEGAARVDEIARMLGGVQITDTTREHAAEMIAAAARAGNCSPDTQH